MHRIHVAGQCGDGGAAQRTHPLQLEVDCLDVLLEALGVVVGLVACGARQLLTLHRRIKVRSLRYLYPAKIHLNSIGLTTCITNHNYKIQTPTNIRVSFDLFKK